MNDSPEPGYVYALVNEDGEIIYVGSTMSGIGARLYRHRCRQPWADEIAGALILASRLNLGQALTREASEIKARRPRYNKLHNPDFDLYYGCVATQAARVAGRIVT